jgi:hypothetical protein
MMLPFMRAPVLHLLLILSGLAGAPHGVHAQQLTLDWHAPAPCPDEAALRAELAGLLAQSNVAAEDLHVAGHVRVEGKQWTLRLELTLPGQRSSRELHGRDCQSLSAAAVWLVALTLDPSLSTRAPADPSAGDPASDDPAVAAGPEQAQSGAEPAPTPSQGSTPPAGTPAAPAADGVEAAASPSASDTRSLAARLGAFGGVFSAGLAGPQASAGLRTGLGLDAYRFELSAIYHFARSESLTVAAGSAQYETLELAIAGCRTWGDTFRAGPCLQLSAMRTRGRASGFAGARTDALFWATAGASGILAYPLSDTFEVRLDAGLWLPISRRPEFFVATQSGENTVGDTHVLGLFARLGLDAKF